MTTANSRVMGGDEDDDANVENRSDRFVSCSVEEFVVNIDDNEDEDVLASFMSMFVVLVATAAKSITMLLLSHEYGEMID